MTVWQILMVAAVVSVAAITLRHSHRKRRRRGSLRPHVDGGYVWTDLDGQEKRSDTDPTNEWNEEDAGDGDGDGGD